MIDLTQTRYVLVLLTPQGEKLYLNEVTQGLQWEEPPDELSVRLTVEVQNQKTRYGWLHKLFPMAGRLFLLADWGEGWKEVWRGTVFDRDNRTDPLGHFMVTAYDFLFYLKSKDNRYYKSGTKGRTILTDVANAWKIPLGKVEGPDAALAKQVMKNQQINSFILDILDQSKKKGAGKFIVRANAGKMDIVKVGGNSPIYHFGATANVKVVSDRESIEDLVTRVKIVGSEDRNKKASVVATIDGRTEFGVLQEIVTKEKNETPAAAKQAAQEILSERGKPKKTRRVEAPDLPFLRKGDKVHITAGTLNGYYIVTGVHHDPDNRTMTMEVEEP